MALVHYSDSESDDETSAPIPVTTTGATTTIPSSNKFQGAQSGKIRVSLPTIKPETTDGPPAKRVRTGGAFSGFNSLLPAPKRTTQNAPKKGVSLKTSSEAAFSRAPAPVATEEDDFGTPDYGNDDGLGSISKEVKLTGKATMFVPPSVASKQKGNAKPVKKTAVEAKTIPTSSAAKAEVASIQQDASESKKSARPKQSLFSMQAEVEEPMSSVIENTRYEPLMERNAEETIPNEQLHAAPTHHTAAASQAPANSTSLSAIAADMNLTPAQRRQLFGRNSNKNTEVSVQNFNLDSEYASNEALRQAGDTFQHRAVKAIAPGKHSLQQLVNNARTQKDAIEDAWAEGRRNRGEGGSKYGWSSG